MVSNYSAAQRRRHAREKQGLPPPGAELAALRARVALLEIALLKISDAPGDRVPAAFRRAARAALTTSGAALAAALDALADEHTRRFVPAVPQQERYVLVRQGVYDAFVRAWQAAKGDPT